MITKEEYNLYKQQVEELKNSQRNLANIGRPLLIAGIILVSLYPILLTLGIANPEFVFFVPISVILFILGLPVLLAGIALSILKSALYNKRINNRLYKIKEFENQNVFENE